MVKVSLNVCLDDNEDRISLSLHYFSRLPSIFSPFPKMRQLDMGPSSREGSATSRPVPVQDDDIQAYGPGTVGFQVNGKTIKFYKQVYKFTAFSNPTLFDCHRAGAHDGQKARGVSQQTPLLKRAYACQVR